MSVARPVLVLTLLFAIYLLLRVPVMYRHPGVQDEDCYAVPGLTVLRHGIPSLPNVPARNPESVFYQADRVLYSEPPLFFYAQAALYAVLPDCYGTARLTSTLAGFAIAGLMLCINGLLGLPRISGYWAVALFLFSRWFYFPAMSARPDMLCAFFGIVGVLLMLKFQRSRRVRWIIATGVIIGMGGLTHPFAIAYAIQFAVWAALVSRSWQRCLMPLTMAVVSIAIMSLWLPLILIAPEVFEIQFKNQFLAPQERSLVYRALMPWESLHYHFLTPQGMVRHIGIWQFMLGFAPVAYCGLDRRERETMFPIVALSLSSIYLISVIVGPHHLVIGYWSYLAALIFLCVGRAVHRIVQYTQERVSTRFEKFESTSAVTVVVAILLTLSLVPGSGIRTLRAYVQNWNVPEYNAPRFAQSLIMEIPPDAVVAVDTEFALDFEIAGRKNVFLTTKPMYFRLDQYSYDYLVLSRLGADSGIDKQLSIRLLKTLGDPDDPFACYAEIYRAVKATP